EAGQKGEKGIKGEIGNQGTTGTTGNQGDKGQKGELGLQGITGAGTQGTTGTQGTQGTTGEGATIANDAATRVTTAVGDGTLNAEEFLTFYGTNLIVTGSIALSGSFKDQESSTGTAGQVGSKTTIIVAPVRTVGAPILFYYNSASGNALTAGMGNTAQTTPPTSET
ncbi:MAG: hypothetical protein ACKVJK_17495, partial [Methylophagaceae bacterium]